MRSGWRVVLRKLRPVYQCRSFELVSMVRMLVLWRRFTNGLHGPDSPLQTTPSSDTMAALHLLPPPSTHNTYFPFLLVALEALLASRGALRRLARTPPASRRRCSASSAETPKRSFTAVNLTFLPHASSSRSKRSSLSGQRSPQISRSIRRARICNFTFVGFTSTIYNKSVSNAKRLAVFNVQCSRTFSQS